MPGTDARPPLRIAIVGAESTGKSVLSHALVDALAGEFGLRCAVVDEYLREWCEQQRRTPRLDEQMGIALEHGRRIDAAAAQPGVDVVVCDTTPLMVSVYSDMLFEDRSLDPVARAFQQRMDATLLTSLDIPWVPDGLQRDGPHVRPPVDAHVRARLLAWGLDFSLIGGLGEMRTVHAIDALRPALSSRFPGLGRAAHQGLASTARPCEGCDDPDCERLAREAARRFR